MLFAGGHTTTRACVMVSALHCAVDFGKVEEHLAHVMEAIPGLLLAMLLAATLALALHVKMHHGLLANFITVTHGANLSIGWLEEAEHLGLELGAFESGAHGVVPTIILLLAASASAIEIGKLLGSRRRKIIAICWIALSLCCGPREAVSLPPMMGNRSAQARLPIIRPHDRESAAISAGQF